MSFYDLRETFDSILTHFKNSVIPYVTIFILLGVIIGMWYYIVLKNNNPNLDMSISYFNRSIITIAVLFLVILILGMWYIFSKGKSNIKFPPMVSTCPDYWKLTKKGKCKNVRKLGNGCPEFDPKDPKYQGPQGKIEKCKWSKNCGVVWDGITNGEKC